MNTNLNELAPSDPDRFRTWLASEYEQRRGRNPRYSLRAFAKFLAVNHSTLSQILRGRRSLTPSQMRRLAERLDLERDMRSLLELAGRPNFIPDVGWCAAQLQWPSDLVAINLQRLVRLGRLRMEGTSWVIL